MKYDYNRYISVHP